MKVPSIAGFPSFGVQHRWQSCNEALGGCEEKGVWAWVIFSRASSPRGDGEAYKLSLTGAM